MFVPSIVLVIILVLALLAGMAVGAAIIYMSKSERGSTRSSFMRGDSDARRGHGASDASHGFVPCGHLDFVERRRRAHARSPLHA